MGVDPTIAELLYIAEKAYSIPSPWTGLNLVTDNYNLGDVINFSGFIFEYYGSDNYIRRTNESKADFSIIHHHTYGPEGSHYVAGDEKGNVIYDSDPGIPYSGSTATYYRFGSE